ncbi:MAG: hypothetical protein HOF96_02680 [Candidatus Marinimicrobia bacterium]|nr:hypothetical protein [Candidatus Neomarinimicrobiota bacterium]MBT3823863.1 hypothetical protein [Candidatus Neomarinimicrobiota bacterium]MBT4131906.1 hypothetical protein [Candidatus Neomarinimicrobiota bacterium]MBT4420840.1 hypothetical protein [Candidatus Neomarinimicrobiota bacterium]MBT4994770.1 hypothetical protein [Candidatus Neomarinimicrobiota bacterium]
MNRLFSILAGLLLSTTLFAQVLMLEPKDNAVSKLNSISVTVAGKAGSPVKLFVNDVEVANDIMRIDGLLDFISVRVPAGPVTLRAEAIGAAERTFTAEKKIHVLGPVGQIKNASEDIIQPADGRNIGKYKFELSDEWGYQLHDIKVVTLKLSSGTLIDKDIDDNSSGHQAKAVEGFVSVNIQSGTEPTERSTLNIQAAGYSQQFNVSYTIPEEPLLLVGAASGSFSTLGKDQDPNALPHFGIINRNNSQLGDHVLLGGRTAFYAKGSIKPGLRLTASLDTDRGYLDQLFVDVDPQEQYPLFGDASTITFDAQSRSKLFAKLEQNESFLLLGDFNTNMTDNEFTAYNRTFNGLLGSYLYKNHEIQVFGTATDRSMEQEEIRGEGISGFYYLNNGSVTRFSEKIRIVTKDRYHPETVLETKNLTRFFDYEINYVDGTLMFKQPIASLDGAGNPIFIVVSYEFQGSNSRSWIGGFRHKSKLGPNEKIRVGTTFLTEERATANYMLYGLDATVPINDKIIVSAEIGQSRKPDDFIDSVAVGNAIKTELQVAPYPGLNLKGYIRAVGDDFVNASQVGSGTERGSFKYGLNAKYDSRKYGKITSEYYDQTGSLGTSNTHDSRVFNMHVERRIKETSTLKFGYENALREKYDASDSLLTKDHSNLLKAQYDVLLLDQIKAVFEHEQNLSLTNRTKPTNTSVGLVYPISEQLEVYWKYRFIQGTGVNRQSVLGFRSTVGENTDIEGKYEIGGITGDQRNRASLGLKNKWYLREDLVVNVSLENTATVDSFEIPTPSHQAMALSFEYLPEMPWKAIGKYEVRDDANSLQRVITLGGDMRIFAGFGAIAKLDHWENRYKIGNQGSQTRENYQAGVAYRPQSSDQINALAKLAYVSDRNSQIAIPVRQDRYIFSVHSYWQFDSKIGLASRFATRFVLDDDATFDESVSTQTYFLQSRAEYAYTNELSGILDMRFIHMSPTSENAFGLAAEVDYLVYQNIQFGVGYILKNYSDADFSFLDYQYHNLYFALHAKFSEDIFNWR